MMMKVKVTENICVAHFVCKWLRLSKVIIVIIFYFIDGFEYESDSD